MDGTANGRGWETATGLEDRGQGKAIGNHSPAKHFVIEMESVCEESVAGVQADGGVPEWDGWLGDFVEQVAGLADETKVSSREEELGGEGGGAAEEAG